MDKFRKILLAAIYSQLLFAVVASNYYPETTNHFLLTEKDGIKPQYLSPFYMQTPDDLFAFLNQSRYQELIDAIYLELDIIKAELQAKFNQVESYAQGFVQQTKCMVESFLNESDLLVSIGTPKYLERVYADIALETSWGASNLEPKCGDFLPLDFSLACFEHLDAMHKRSNLSMAEEEPLRLRELGLIRKSFGNMLVTGLKRFPTTWQWHTLASYHWRLRGNAPEAVECARRALHLAPIKHRDIAMLSLGTILQRSRHHSDAVVILEAATDLNPRAAENYFALANSLTLLSDFNRSMPLYETVRKLDGAFEERINYLKNALVCFKYVKSKLKRIEAIIAEISKLLRQYSERKTVLEDYMLKMHGQQVPLARRELKVQEHVVSEQVWQAWSEAKHREKYCTGDTATTTKYLVCDFREVTDDGISSDLINRYLDQTRELINTHKRSMGVFEQLNVDHLEDRHLSGFSTSRLLID